MTDKKLRTGDRASNTARKCHVVPRVPSIDLRSPGRLRTAHVLALCAISHSTLYTRLKAGAFPRPDGRDGGQNYWSTSTIVAYLEKPASLGKEIN